ncbi:MAG: hypothetical protein J6A59_15010 [Lachnospiraceae bacterium]|nr:hypothetical protein [Lachnospiraceae bacterium]
MADKAPCKGCTDRYLGCHDKCDKYREFKQYNEELKNKIRQEKQYDGMLHEYNKAKESGIKTSKFRK